MHLNTAVTSLIPLQSYTPIHTPNQSDSLGLNPCCPSDSRPHRQKLQELIQISIIVEASEITRTTGPTNYCKAPFSPRVLYAIFDTIAVRLTAHKTKNKSKAAFVLSWIDKDCLHHVHKCTAIYIGDKNTLALQKLVLSEQTDSQLASHNISKVSKCPNPKKTTPEISPPIMW